jgi:TolB-like protein
MLRRDGRTKEATPAIRSLVVLPLKNLSGNPEQEFFVDGMTEELIGQLSKIQELRVISRTSAMTFKDTHKSVPEIAQALHVDAIVEGSVMRDGRQVRVSVQLIRGATDEHIWSEKYERNYAGILVLQEEVARSIVTHIKGAMTASAQAGLRASTPLDPLAYENYLKGRYYLNQRTEEALKKSIVLFQDAIARDPNYALAYCGMADTYALLGFRGGLPSREMLSQAKAAAAKAVQLNDRLPDAHVSLAFIAETHEWNWRTAEREYKRALELNDGDARTHHWYAGYLMYTGQFDQGIEEEKRARQLDPLSLPINNALAGRLLVAGQYEEALSQVRETLEMNPHFAPAHQTIGWLYLNTGKHEEAIQEFQEALQLSGADDTDYLLDLGFAYAVTGNRVEASKVLAELTERHERGLAPSGSIGILYGALGDLNRAFNWLDKAYEERDPELTYLKVPNRRFGPLRHDARYQQLLRRIGLPE